MFFFPPIYEIRRLKVDILAAEREMMMKRKKNGFDYIVSVTPIIDRSTADVVNQNNCCTLSNGRTQH